MGAAWKVLRVALPVAATAGALVFVGYAIDWAEVAGIALSTPMWAVIACALIVLAELAVAGLRLNLLSSALGAPLALPASMSVWSIAHLAGLVLPTSVGNEIVKGGFLLKVTPKPARVIGVLAVERVVATTALGLLVLASVPVAVVRLDHPLAPLVIAVCALALAVLVVVYAFRHRLVGLAKRGARMARVSEKGVDDFADILSRVPFIQTVFLSLMIHLATVGLIAILLGALGAGDPLTVAILGAPLVILVSLLPISVGGFGVREGAFVLVFGLFGTQPAIAASVGLAWWGVQVIAAIAGCTLAAAWFASAGRKRMQAEVG